MPISFILSNSTGSKVLSTSSRMALQSLKVASHGMSVRGAFKSSESSVGAGSLRMLEDNGWEVGTGVETGRDG